VIGVFAGRAFIILNNSLDTGANERASANMLRNRTHPPVKCFHAAINQKIDAAVIATPRFVHSARQEDFWWVIHAHAT
jgi:hypothetical protein